MTQADNAARATPSPDGHVGLAEAETTSGHDFATVAWLARHFGRPFSASSVRTGLPEPSQEHDPDLLARALSRVGLKSRLAERSIKDIDPVVLPVVLFEKTGKAVVLKDINPLAKTALVVDPETDSEREIPFKSFAKTYQPQVMFVTIQSDRAISRLAPETAALAPSGGHWFWGPVRANWGAWVQILLAALVINVLSLALPIFVMNVYDRVIPNLAYVTLWTLAIGVAIAVLLDLLMRTVRANVLENIGRRVDLKVASTLFDQAMRVRLLNRPGGAAGIANSIRDFETVREFFASATFVAVIDLMFIGIFVLFLYVIVGPIAIVPLIAVPVVIALAAIAQIPLGRTAGMAQQMATKRHGVLIETLAGIESIKSLNAEPVMQREWENAVAASSRINGKTRFWSNFATNSTLAIQQAVSVIIVVWGVYLVAEGRISVGGLIAANILAGRVLAPLGAIAQTIFRAQYAFKAMAALTRFMDLPTERSSAVTSDAVVKHGSIALNAVNFTYPNAQVPALKDLSIDIRSGEIVALLGKVGSGKTTTGKLLAGLLQPDSGTVLIDGISIAQYEPAELRDGIGYLPQDPELFTGTIRENLIIGRPSATDADIHQALWYAAMDEFVSETPKGLDLFIGERGNQLSGGQRQGIALARLLLRAPQCLFLDEPTNAMDQRMETDVITRLKQLNAQGTGLILCTHRMSLAAIADRFAIMDHGRIVLDGPREQVLKKLHENSATRAGT
jgi:ATP-binding cassette subfamily C protein LapB